MSKSIFKPDGPRPLQHLKDLNRPSHYNATKPHEEHGQNSRGSFSILSVLEVLAPLLAVGLPVNDFFSTRPDFAILSTHKLPSCKTLPFPS
jgi:hypothetical protein